MNKNPENISVIGAGIMGISAAYALQQRFSDTIITLYDENGFPANNASFAAGGMIAPLSELDHMPQSYLSAGFDAIDEWQKIADALPTPFEFSTSGSLFITHSADRHLFERFQSLLPHSNEAWEKIDAQKIKSLEPALNTNIFRQGLYMKKEAHLHPQKAMQAMLEDISHKKTTTKHPVKEAKKTDWVIDCRGIKAKGARTDLRGVKGEVLVVRNTDFSLSRPLRLMHPRYPLYIVPRDDHIFMIGATIIESDSKSHVSLRSSMELMSALYSIDRSFGEAEILEIKSGIRPSYPDNLPRINIDENIIQANGLYRHGFLFSPIIAQTIAHYIAGKTYQHSHLFFKEDADEHTSERRAAYA